MDLELEPELVLRASHLCQSLSLNPVFVLLARSYLTEVIFPVSILARQELEVLTELAHDIRPGVDSLPAADHKVHVVVEERHNLAGVDSFVVVEDSLVAGVDSLAVVVGSLAG